MKKRLEAFLVAALFGLAFGAQASPTIELKDGSRIEGDIQSVENGVYTLISPSLGTVHVAQSNIARIDYSGGDSKAEASSGKTSAHDDAFTRGIQQMQSSMAQDSRTVQSIMSLQSDPQIQALLADPAIMKAIEQGDYSSLLGNPKIQALESNEHLKEIVQQQAH